MSATIPSNANDEGVLRFLTAGSVDDGKSTLIGRLLYDSRGILSDQLAAIERTSQQRGGALDLSLLTDGLTAEREQGITIDVAYRYFATPRRKFIIADAPGHEQYTRNMVTAASTAQLAVLLVDARRGILPQTRRHATLAHLVGVRQLVVAVNKMDLVGWQEEVFAGIVGEFTEFAERSGIDGLRFVPVSAISGDMVAVRGEHLSWYDGPTLLEILESAEVDDDLAQQPFRFPVQYVLRPTAHSPRGYTGRVESGGIAVGDVVTVLPSGTRTTIRTIRTPQGLRNEAGLHEAVTLVLADELDISRGDMLVHAVDAPTVARSLDANICWLGHESLDVQREYVLRHTTREVRAKVGGIASRWNVSTQAHEPAPASLAMNEIGRVRMVLGAPVLIDRYAENRVTGSFILVDPRTNNTVAAGMVQ